VSEYRNLPQWVWELLDAIDTYEDEHAPLFRMATTGAYQPAQCIGSYLSDREASVPADVQEAAKFRKEILRQVGAFECPKCQQVSAWTDGMSRAAGDEHDEFWCQQCGAETRIGGAK
jgi:predicted RNA-binding Zn-ribbon protein involved in translation (DUF1610 family)